MIIVLFARDAEALRTTWHYIQTQHCGYSAYVNLARVADVESRLMQLQQIPDRKTERRVTVVFNPQTARELHLLRGMGAVVCHQCGPLSPLYTHEISISPLHDLHYVPSLSVGVAPGHVLAVDEVLSECKIIHRKFRLRAK